MDVDVDIDEEIASVDMDASDDIEMSDASDEAIDDIISDLDDMDNIETGSFKSEGPDDKETVDVDFDIDMDSESDEMSISTDEDIDRNIINVCRCATYYRMRKAIHRAAEIKNSNS